MSPAPEDEALCPRGRRQLGPRKDAEAVLALPLREAEPDCNPGWISAMLLKMVTPPGPKGHERGQLLGAADVGGGLKGTQPEVIRAICCSGIAFYHNPR